MKFTVVFSSNEAIDLSYGLVFVPCSVWIKGEKTLINLNPDNPHYHIGSVRRLLDAEPIEENLGDSGRHCTVVVHPDGHGDTADLQKLVTDLEQENFRVTVVDYNG